MHIEPKNEGQKAMRYRELFVQCSKMTDEQLDADVVIHLHSEDAFFAVDHLELVDCQEEDRMPDGHPVLIVFDCDINE